MKNKLISASIATPTISPMAFTLGTQTSQYSPEEKLARLSQLEKLAGNDTAEYAYDETLYKKFARTKAAGEISDSQYAIIKERAAQLTTMVYPGDTRLSEREQKEIIVLTIKLWTNDIIGLPTAKGISTPNILDAIEKIMTFLGNKAPCNRLQFCRELVELCINMKTAGMIRFVSEAATLLPALLAGTAHEVNSNIKSLATLIQTEKTILENKINAQSLFEVETAKSNQEIGKLKGIKDLLANSEIIPETQKTTIAFEAEKQEILEIIQEISAPGNLYTKLSFRQRPYELFVGDVGATLLAQALKHINCNITDVDLFRSAINDAGINAITNALIHENNKVRFLNVSQNWFSNAELQNLINALTHKNCLIETLITNSANLHAGILNIECIEVLTTTLIHGNCKLTNLSLDNHHIGNIATIKLANALKHENCKLTSLSLGDNIIKSAGIKALTDALKHENGKLKALDLHDNPINTEGTKLLIEALLHKNCKLQSLNILDCFMGKNGAQQILEALKDPNCKIFDYKGPYADDTKLQQIFEQRKLAYKQMHGNKP